MRIFLIGMMAAGKTTYGRQLAQALKLPFIDLDTTIEEQTGQTIPELFAVSEQHFRAKESEALQQQVDLNAAFVMATGGGTPCYGANLELMQQHGPVVFLFTPLETVAERLKKEQAKRPLVAQLSEMEIAGWLQEKYQQRLPFYLQAQVAVSTLGFPPRKLAQQLELRR